MRAPSLHDLACVVHLHSTHSDGTGTVAQIAAAGARAGVDVVLLTDHDTVAARSSGEEGWYGPTLLLVGEEVSPSRQDHTLVFGERLVEPIDHEGMSGADILREASRLGLVSFAAHPFSRGSDRYRRFGPGMPHTGVASEALTGIELWSFVTDTAEELRSVREGLTFAAAPRRVVDHPRQRNLVEWDRLCASRRVVAIGGLDAHQIGVRVRGRVPLRLMGYARAFRQLRTHVLASSLLTGDVSEDRALVVDALREGRCYLAMDSLAPARGFSFWSNGGLVMGAEAAFEEGTTLHARLPRPATLRLVRDGVLVSSFEGASLDYPVRAPGVYRVEARLPYAGRERTWIVSNPIYLRA